MESKLPNLEKPQAKHKRPWQHVGNVVLLCVLLCCPILRAILIFFHNENESMKSLVGITSTVVFFSLIGAMIVAPIAGGWAENRGSARAREITNYSARLACACIFSFLLASLLQAATGNLPD